MSNLPIAALLARDAVERQFQPKNLGGRNAEHRVPQAQTLRVAAARALHRVADRLEPRRVSPGPSH
jgi:hypothetical protein